MAGQQGRQDPKEAALAAARVPEPAPGAGDRPGVPGQRVLRRPRRGAGQVRDGAQGQGRRRPGHRGRRGVRVLPARVLRGGRRAGVAPGWKGWCRPGPGRAAPASSPSRSSPGPRSSWPPTPRCARRSWPADRGGLRRARAPPLGRASAGPPPGAPLQKPRTCPPARRGRRITRPCPCSPSPGHAAAEPGARPDAGQDTCPRRRAGRPLRATASCRPARARRGVPARARRADPQGRHRLAACPGRPGPRRTRAGLPARPPGPAADSRPRWPPSSSTCWPPSRSPDPPPARPRNRLSLKETPMLPDTAASKVTAAHLSRTAVLLLGSSANVQVRMGVVCGRRR